MKSAALCLLAISAPGCNWLLGLDKTVQLDAHVPLDAPLPTARLTWLVAVTDSLGGPVSTLEHHAISPAPTIQVGRIAGELSAAPIDDTGTIQIPYEFENSTWRLVYQLANDVPHEIHWTSMTGRIPHAIVPIFGRIDRAPIPGGNTTMVMTPSNNLPTEHTIPRVFTTGVWTHSKPAFGFPMGPTFSYNLNQSVQLSGPAGAPDPTKGDQVVLVDFATPANCHASFMSAAFKLQLANGPSTTLAADDWLNNSKVVQVVDRFGDRVRVSIAASATTGSVSTIMQLGPAASSAMPAFTQRGAERMPRLGLHGPLMLPMLDCEDIPNPMPSYDLPRALSVFPHVAHLQVTADRIVSGGPTLTHGLAAVMPIVNDMAQFDINVAMPLFPYRLDMIDLAASDGTPIPPGSAPLVLTFNKEPDGVADYYDVLLHRVSGTSTVVERVYTIVAPSLTIERSILTAGTQYVFEIRAFRGAPKAKLTDFTEYLPTQSSAVVWTHTFIPQ